MKRVRASLATAIYDNVGLFIIYVAEVDRALLLSENLQSALPVICYAQHCITSLRDYSVLKTKKYIYIYIAVLAYIS